MRDSWKGAFKAAGVFAGTAVGAGFASGQELSRFFARYGGLGFAGLCLAGGLMAFIGWAVMDICAREGVSDYGGFLNAVFGRPGKAVEYATMAFVAVLYCAMLSGVGAMAEEGFGLPFTAGAAALGAVCLVALMFGAEGVVRLNAALAPLLIAGGLAVGVYGMTHEYIPAFAGIGRHADNWLVSALIYASYNMVTAVPILAGLGGAVITSRKAAGPAGGLGGLGVTALGLCFAAPIAANFGYVGALEMPMLALSRGYGSPLLAYGYIAVLCAAILTTAAGNGFAVVEWMGRRFGVSRFRAALGLTVLGVAAAHVGFSAMVGKVYPFFGYLGLFELAVVAGRFLTGRRR